MISRKTALRKAVTSKNRICDENNGLFFIHIRPYKDFLQFITDD